MTSFGENNCEWHMFILSFFCPKSHMSEGVQLQCKAAMEAEEMARLEELAAEAAQERWLLGSCISDFPGYFLLVTIFR